MNGTFRFTSPMDMQATVSFTAQVKDIVSIRDDLGKLDREYPYLAGPSKRFKAVLDELVRDAERVYLAQVSDSDEPA